jgi:hypothetical protein
VILLRSVGMALGMEDFGAVADVQSRSGCHVSCGRRGGM